MEVLTFCPREYFGSNTYLIFSGNECAVVDPSVSYSKLDSLIKEKGCALRYVILTHAHFDHMLEIDSWVNGNDAQVLVGKGDVPMLSNAYYNCYKTFLGIDKGYFGHFIAVNEDDAFDLGGEKISFIETPGHTLGSVSVLIGDAVFVGDTVFADGGVGRCDLPWSDSSLLDGSIAKLLKLPVDIAVYSGHGKKTTVKNILNKLL